MNCFTAETEVGSGISNPPLAYWDASRDDLTRHVLGRVARDRSRDAVPIGPHVCTAHTRAPQSQTRVRVRSFLVPTLVGTSGTWISYGFPAVRAGPCSPAAMRTKCVTKLLQKIAQPLVAQLQYAGGCVSGYVQAIAGLLLNISLGAAAGARRRGQVQKAVRRKHEGAVGDLVVQKDLVANGQRPPGPQHKLAACTARYSPTAIFDCGVVSQVKHRREITSIPLPMCTVAAAAVVVVVVVVVAGVVGIGRSGEVLCSAA